MPIIERANAFIPGSGKNVRVAEEDHAVIAAIADHKKASFGIIVADAIAAYLTQNPDLQVIADKALANAA